MDYQLSNNLLCIGASIAFIIWTILAMNLLISLYKQNWSSTKRTLKYILNTSVFIIALMFLFEWVLIVRAPIYETKQASSVALKLWIQESQFKDAYIALVVIAILFGINLLFHIKVEKGQHRKDLFILTAFDILVLSFGIWLTGQLAYFGLIQEIDRHFG